jgi:hypothetical protein
MLLLPEEQTGEDWERSKSDALLNNRIEQKRAFTLSGFKRLSIASPDVYKYRPTHLEH